MAAKREQILYESVWSIAEKLEIAFNLKAICSAGIVLFYELNGDQQIAAIAKVKNTNKKITTKKPSYDTLQQTLDMIKEMAEIERQQPGTVYRVLTAEQQSVLQEFIKEVSPDFERKKKKKKA